MHRRTPIALLLSLAAFAIVCLPANAVTIHKHMVVHRVVGHDPDGPVKVAQEVVRVETVPPADSDDDGCANAQDSYNGPGCSPPPKPAPTVAAPVESVAPSTPTTTSVPTASGGCPSYMAAEASSPTAVNPTSGASGCYQVLPSTAAAMGAACSDVNSSSCVAAICATSGNGAWASSGATPCDYIEP